MSVQSRASGTAAKQVPKGDSGLRRKTDPGVLFSVQHSVSKVHRRQKGDRVEQGVGERAPAGGQEPLTLG